MLTKKAVDKISPHLDYKNLKGDDNEMLIYAMLESKVKVENLIPRLNAITEQNTEARIYVRGDRVVAYGRIM